MGTLTISAVWDPSVTALNTSGSPTYNPTLYQEFTSAVNSAVGYFQSSFTTVASGGTTLSIDFAWGQASNSAAVVQFGGTVSSGVITSNALPNDSVSGADVANSNANNLTGTGAAFISVMSTALLQPGDTAAQKNAWASVISTAPASGTYTLPSAELKDLGVTTPQQVTSDGLSGGFETFDGVSTLNSTSGWAWTQSNVPSNLYDAVATEEHEISEVMGRVMYGGELVPGSIATSGADSGSFVPTPNVSISGGVVLSTGTTGSGGTTVTVVSGGIASIPTSGPDFELLDFFDYAAATPTSAGTVVSSGSAAGAQVIDPATSNVQTYIAFPGSAVGLPFSEPVVISGGRITSGDIADWGSSVDGDAYGGGTGFGAISQSDTLAMVALGLVACFATGSRIATLDGLVPVERLRVGQRVLTAAGGWAPIVRIGRREIDLADDGLARKYAPVRVRPNAFGPRQPTHDLVLSPDHCVFFAGHLVPVRELVNGTSIVQEAAARMTYWHVELPLHEIILAENLAVESYLETGDEHGFAWETSRAPLLLHGPRLEEIRVRLAA